MMASISNTVCLALIKLGPGPKPEASSKAQKSNQANSQTLSGLTYREYHGPLTATGIYVPQEAQGKVWLVPKHGSLAYSILP